MATSPGSTTQELSLTIEIPGKDGAEDSSGRPLVETGRIPFETLEENKSSIL